eukprot:TRINITY_DN1285_c0_g1_i1.p1 TRINITY_DN1285_c0_g1~~TRINITY_DN1285_c0_g1_i1.p1  ORF type:complete len:337 (+),score=55.36 TRINITY_DN1285_c0_g1_i1:76-1086(+)
MKEGTKRRRVELLGIVVVVVLFIGWSSCTVLEDTLYKKATERLLERCKNRDVENVTPVNSKVDLEGEEVTYFLHIEKCGGSTLTEWINSNVPTERLLNLRFHKGSGGFEFGWSNRQTLEEHGKLDEFRELFKKHNLIIGHVAYGLHEITPERKHHYITMLREPTDRLLSQYHWWRKLYGPEFVQNSMLTFFENKVGLDGLRMHKDNHLTRVLCSRDAMELIPPGQLTHKQLYCAMKHLMQIEVVMIMERYEESMKSLSAVFDWNQNRQVLKEIGNSNGRHASTKKILPTDVLQAIQNLTMYDNILYEFGNCLMDRKVHKLKTSDRWPSWTMPAPDI